MKRVNIKNINYIVLIFFLYGTVTAESHNNKSHLHIQADKMIASPHQKKIIFQGHVKVTQENIQLTADTLDVYLISTNQSVAITKESVQKVNARGHVRVHWKAYRIEADTAIYLPQKKKLIVNGNMARLYQGKNSIAGSQIVVNLITDQVEISSNKGEQVEAFYEFSEQEMKKIKQQKNNP